MRELAPELAEILVEYPYLFVGFSGGLDSAVLLHIVCNTKELKNKIQVVHVNHGISPNAQNWESEIEVLCKQLNLPLIIKRVRLANPASNLEEEARKCRYEVFSELMLKHPGSALLLAHHQDDQAETLLLQLCRGTGVEGLSGMLSHKSFASGALIRPLLHHSRKTLEGYAELHQLDFVKDESNNDCKYSRNFIRHKIIPLLEQRWPKVQLNLTRTAAHCRDASMLLKELAAADCSGLNSSPFLENQNHLNIHQFEHLSVIRITNIIRTWVLNRAIRAPSTATLTRVITELIFARPDSSPEVKWGAYCLKRYQNHLYLLQNWQDAIFTDLPWTSFPNPLELPQGLGGLEAVRVTGNSKHDEDCGSGNDIGFNNNLNIKTMSILIANTSVPTIRFRKGGEVFFYRGHNKQIKKLFQEWQVPPWMRDRIPLLYLGEELAAIVGYAVSDHFYRSGCECEEGEESDCYQLFYTKPCEYNEV